MEAGMAVVLPKKKRSPTYAPPPPALLDAIRVELKKLVDDPELDRNLGHIATFASQADDLLAVVKAPEAVMRDENELTIPGVALAPPNAETYGATVIRAVVDAVEKWQKREQETPASLVSAIALARSSGMTDVAAELEERLTGKRLDGGRPCSIGLADAQKGVEMLAADGQAPPPEVNGLLNPTVGP